jgi:putative glutathione S-transferase
MPRRSTHGTHAQRQDTHGDPLPARPTRIVSYVRPAAAFRHLISNDGSTAYPAEAGRYHLYGSLACPWVHRTVLVRRLKGLEDAVGYTPLDPVRDQRGWRFTAQDPDPLHGWSFLSEAYEATSPGWEGTITAPLLWDSATGRIVNNESREIMEILDSAFAELGDPDAPALYPEQLRREIDELDGWIYAEVNNGVYKAGFAASQSAYDEAIAGLFAALHRLDGRLADRRFLLGARATLADWRLFTTLVRFDLVYVSHFKCNIKRIADFDHLSGYLRDLFQTPGVAETIALDDIKRHYYLTQPKLNPSRIVPAGPTLNLDAPHDRAMLGG